jgi:hypothetical protein
MENFIPLILLLPSKVLFVAKKFLRAPTVSISNHEETMIG